MQGDQANSKNSYLDMGVMLATLKNHENFSRIRVFC